MNDNLTHMKSYLKEFGMEIQPNLSGRHEKKPLGVSRNWKSAHKMWTNGPSRRILYYVLVSALTMTKIQTIISNKIENDALLLGSSFTNNIENTVENELFW